MSRKYAIIETSSVTPSMAAATVDNGTDSMRKTVRNTDKCLLRWDGNTTPSGAESLTVYTHDEILNILNDESGDWWVDFESYRDYEG